ncbi:hypothetical protein D3C74_481830 [compost metagenome]
MLNTLANIVFNDNFQYSFINALANEMSRIKTHLIHNCGTPLQYLLSQLFYIDAFHDIP